MRTMTERGSDTSPCGGRPADSASVSIGDMVKARIGELEEERAHLHFVPGRGS